MIPLIEYWMRTNYHINANDAKRLININDLEHQVKHLKALGFPILSEVRHELNETTRRYWLAENYVEKYREANR